VKYILGTVTSKHALFLSRAYYEVILDSYPKFLTFTLVEQLEAYLVMASWNIKHFVKNAKYFTAAPLARFLKNPLPVRPASFPQKLHIMLFSGRIKVFFKNRLIAFNPKNLRFFFGMLQGVKRGSATVPDEFKDAALEGHYQTMSRPYDPIKATSWAQRATFKSFFQRLVKKCKPVTPTLFEASTSAGLRGLTDQGGQRGFIKRDSQNIRPHAQVTAQSALDLEGKKVKVTNFNVPTEQDELLEMYEHRPGVVKRLTGLATWAKFAHFDIDQEFKKSHEPLRSKFLSDEHLEDDEPVMDIEDYSTYIEREPLQSVVVALCEPLKVRLITKGDDFAYYRSRFFQKYMWNYLQNFPQFAVTGRPLQESDLHNLIYLEDRLFGLNWSASGNVIKKEKPFSFWVSGDYSAATDNLKVSYTKDAFECFLVKSGLTNDQCEDLRAVLYEQVLVYPTYLAANHGHSPKVLQTSGQLMGSTLSFPILCSINLVTYWKALEEMTGLSIQLKDLPVLINGDDILFRANDLLYSLWEENTKEVGFELSLGKNYTHPTVLTINSECWMFNRGDKTFKRAGFLNVGLLTGLYKNNKRIKELMPINACYNQMIAGAVNKFRAHGRFLHYNKKDVEIVTKSGQFSLFINPAFGGCGFDLVDEMLPSVSFTNFQKKLAFYLRKKVINDYEGPRVPVPVGYRLPGADETAMTINSSRSLYHYGRYRFIPLTQPLGSSEIEPEKSALSNFLNVGTVMVGDTLTSIDHYKTSLMLKGFRDTKLPYEVNFRKANLWKYTKFDFKLVEDKDFTLKCKTLRFDDLTHAHERLDLDEIYCETQDMDLYISSVYD